MVTYNSNELNEVFKALSDPTRRDIIFFLKRGSCYVSQVRAYFPISGPAVTKHLSVLEHAKLITRTKIGRNVIVRLEENAIEDAKKWIEEYSTFWNKSFDNLDDYLKK